MIWQKPVWRQIGSSGSFWGFEHPSLKLRLPGGMDHGRRTADRGRSPLKALAYKYRQTVKVQYLMIFFLE